ncbi:MAG: hypothetical protein WCV99_01765 [Sterolibacterium sp.]
MNGEGAVKAYAWPSSLYALGYPWLWACILYFTTAAFVMPLRFQFGIHSDPISGGSGPAWIDVGIVLVLSFAATAAMSVKKARHTAQLLARSPLDIVASLALSPIYTFVGRWFWEPASSGMLDSSTGGKQLFARGGLLITLVFGTLLVGAVVALLVFLAFSLPVMATKLLGNPITIPCIAIELMGDPHGLIRVRCNQLPLEQWYDHDALWFALALCSVWSAIAVVQGSIAIAKAMSLARRFR